MLRAALTSRSWVVPHRLSLTVDGRAEPISVQIVEASPDRLLVKNVDFGYEGDIGTTFALDVPEGGRLRRR
jgi:hypothetical protein